MENIRVEKKFVLGKYQDDFLKKTLLSCGFNQIFSQRKIDSIYLDTRNFDFAKDNINGVSARKKLRFRWYNNDLKNVYLEEKRKRNFLVEKKIDKLSLPVNHPNLIQNLKEYLNDKNKVDKSFNYKFILKTRYIRSYWMSCDKKIRATIDKDLSMSSVFNLNQILNLNETILEFKFLPSNENYFRDFFTNNNLNLRSKKFSKYIQGLGLLEESGLIS